MIFSSLNFLLVFLPIVLIVYYAVPFRFKNIWLLIASIVFYAWGEPVYIILMLLSIAFNYVTGLQFEAIEEEKARKKQLVFAVAVNLLLLGFYKYAPLFVNTLMSIVRSDYRWTGLSLPIGISFYTFQALSYVIDVYRRKVKTQRKIIDFALYITMFPQLIAGPIVRYTDIETQLNERRISKIKTGQGIERLIYGLAKKVILANNIGMLHAAIQNMESPSVMTAWLGVAAYSFQIYFDFSGYSDMAIGMGKMLGFSFPENFNFPYTAISITDAWRRWHMTLSGWFREYVYIPLGGNKVSPGRHILNLLIVWMLTGFWHGAGWNFMLWGLYFGVLLILEKYVLAPYIAKWPKAVQHIYAAGLFCLGWVFFFNTDFGQMGAYFGHLIGIGAHGFVDSAFFYYFKNNLVLLILCVLCAGPLIRNLIVRISKRIPIMATVISAVFLIVSMAFLVYGSYNPFLYFRF